MWKGRVEGGGGEGWWWHGELQEQVPALTPLPVCLAVWGQWGYHTIEETEAVWANYSAFNIPLDTMFNDIDYMDAYLDFTTDPVRVSVASLFVYLFVGC